MARGKTLPFAFRCAGADGKSGCNQIVATKDLGRKMQDSLAKEGITKYCPTCKVQVVSKGKQHKHS